MTDFKFKCPHCKQPLEAPPDMMGEVTQCPTCKGTIQLSPMQCNEPPTLPPTEGLATEVKSDAATEKQLAFIRDLGGTPLPGLTKAHASKLIDHLRNNASPTQKQLNILQKFGATFPSNITSAQAADLIFELDANQDPTIQQVKFIKMHGGEVPVTKREASEVCETLRNKSPATNRQKQRATALGITIPENVTFAQAETIIDEAEMDVDEEFSKPATKAQINKIIRLGGNPAKAINRWRADHCIEALEEKEEAIKNRVAETLDWFFFDPLDREMLPFKKPTKAIMREILEYGDAQGWGENWATKDDASGFDLMPIAVKAVAPQLLRESKSHTRLREKSSGRGTPGKGCLTQCILMFGVCTTLVVLLIAVFISRQLEQGKTGAMANNPLLARVRQLGGF